MHLSTLPRYVDISVTFHRAFGIVSLSVIKPLLLLFLLILVMHYCTQPKCQYRSAIFYCNEDQRNAALKKIEEFSKGGERKVYVDVEPVSAFYKGEEYHQNFLEKQMSARVPRF